MEAGWKLSQVIGDTKRITLVGNSCARVSLSIFCPYREQIPRNLDYPA